MLGLPRAGRLNGFTRRRKEEGGGNRLAFAIIIAYIYCNAAKQSALPDRGSVIVRVSEPPLILTRLSPTASLFTRVVKQTPLVGVAPLRAFDIIFERLL
jgi:hypothetical protein